MAVAFDAVGPSSSGTGSATSPLTWSHTCGASATAILVGATIFTGSTNDITAVTYGGQALSLLGFIAGGGSTAGGIALYYQANPLTGANTVSVTFTGGNNTNAGSISVTGSAGAGTPVTAASAGNATSVSATVAGTTVGGLIVATASYGGTSLSTFSGTNGVTVQWQHPGSASSGADNGVGGTVASAGGSQAVGFTDTGSDLWGIVAVELLPPAGGSYPSPGSRIPPGRRSPMAFRTRTSPPPAIPNPPNVFPPGLLVTPSTAVQDGANW